MDRKLQGESLIMARKTIRTIPQQRTPIPTQEPEARVTNFEEVAIGYTEEHALLESERCLMCPQPACIPACPVNINIPGFIQKIIEKDFTILIFIKRNFFINFYSIITKFFTNYIS